MDQTATRRPPYQYGRAYRVPLTTTSATVVLAQPVSGRNVLVRVEGSMVVGSGGSTITVTAAWTDPDGGAQTAYLYLFGTTTALNAYSASAGVLGFESQPLLCEMDTTLTVTATAGTANKVTLTVAPLGA